MNSFSQLRVFNTNNLGIKQGVCTHAILRRKCFADLAHLIDNAYQYIKYDLEGNLNGDMRMLRRLSLLESTEQRTQLKT